MDPALVESFALPLLDFLAERSQAGQRRPLLALNGPVGAGKSSLARWLAQLAPERGLCLAVASIDDLYLPWPQRRRALEGNPFGVGRVPPGSHDLALLQAALADWRRHGSLRLPRFDKSLAAGHGDRQGWREQRADALLLEGWLMGCRPLGAEAFGAEAFGEEALGEEAHRALALAELPEAALAELTPEERRWLPHWDRQLAAYLPIWQACDGLALLRPLHRNLPRRWRFQAEARQRRAGGGWLAPEELHRLVRASLCSLPPVLYQDPLLPPGWLPGEGGAQKPRDGEGLNGNRPGGGQLHSANLPGMALPPGGLPVVAVAELDGRRRCRSVWLPPQASASSPSSAIG